MDLISENRFELQMAGMMDPTPCDVILVVELKRDENDVITTIIASNQLRDRAKCFLKGSRIAIPANRREYVVSAEDQYIDEEGVAHYVGYDKDGNALFLTDYRYAFNPRPDGTRIAVMENDRTYVMTAAL
jgi:hypothetical protein